MSRAPSTFYHDDRLAVMITVVVLGLVLSALIPLPAQEIILDLFGSELALRFSGPVQMIIIMGAIVCAGVDTLVRAYLQLPEEPVPATRRSRALEIMTTVLYSATFWALPTLLTILGLVILQNLIWWGYQIVFAFIVGGVLAAIVSFQLATYSVEAAPSRGLRLLLNGISYGTAFVLFAMIYGARLRSLLSATGILMASGVLALELFRNAEAASWRIWLYAGITGLIMGELTWVLNYTRYSNRLGGALLLLGFYTLTGLTQQHLWQRLDRRVVTEYLVVLIVGLIILVILL